MNKIRTEYRHNNMVASVILDDGKGNILDHLMMEELHSTLKGFTSRKDLKLIVFEGAGKHFSFGASVEEHRKELAATMLRQFHQLFYSIRDLAIPTLAKISGQCLGGGLELAIMCDVLFADTSAKLGQPEIVLGVFPPPASIILPEKIGLARAEELLITGRSIGAAEAKEIGLLSKLFDSKTEMEEGIEKWIGEHILPKSASSLRFAVRASRVKFNHVLSNFLPQLEFLYVNQLMQTKDSNEGIESFIEKRKPVWANE